MKTPPAERPAAFSCAQGSDERESQGQSSQLVPRNQFRPAATARRPRFPIDRMLFDPGLFARYDCVAS